MHFEILVEDVSGKIALESILQKILDPNGQDHTYRIISYKGIGRIPKNLRGTTDPQKRILLDRLPKLLRGYGKSLQNFPATADAVYPGGSQKLKELGWPHTGKAKCAWANNIAPHLDVENNQSRSFQVFRDGIRDRAGIET